MRNLIQWLRAAASALTTSRPEALDGPTLAAKFQEHLGGDLGKLPTVIEYNFTSTGAEIELDASDIPALGLYGTAAYPQRIRVHRAEIVNVTDGIQADYWRTIAANGSVVEKCVLAHTGALFADGLLVDEGDNDLDEAGNATITIGAITGINSAADKRCALRLYLL